MGEQPSASLHWHVMDFPVRPQRVPLNSWAQWGKTILDWFFFFLHRYLKAGLLFLEELRLNGSKKKKYIGYYISYQDETAQNSLMCGIWLKSFVREGGGGAPTASKWHHKRRRGSTSALFPLCGEGLPHWLFSPSLPTSGGHYWAERIPILEIDYKGWMIGFYLKLSLWPRRERQRHRRSRCQASSRGFPSFPPARSR